jgi:hypothetical protein
MRYEGIASAGLHKLSFDDIRWHFFTEEYIEKHPTVKSGAMEIKTSRGDAGFYTPVSITNRNMETIVFVVNQAVEFMDKHKFDYCAAYFDGNKPVFSDDHGFTQEEIHQFF